MLLEQYLCILVEKVGLQPIVISTGVVEFADHACRILRVVNVKEIQIILQAFADDRMKSTDQTRFTVHMSTLQAWT